MGEGTKIQPERRKRVKWLELNIFDAQIQHAEKSYCTFHCLNSVLANCCVFYDFRRCCLYILLVCVDFHVQLHIIFFGCTCCFMRNKRMMTIMMKNLRSTTAVTVTTRAPNNVEI